MINYQELSKEVSYALRNAPWEYELEMDDEGWVPVQQLLDSLHKDNKWENVQEEDICTIIAMPEKKRHEMVDGRIRAFYGHSIPMHIKNKRCLQIFCIMELPEDSYQELKLMQRGRGKMGYLSILEMKRYG